MSRQKKELKTIALLVAAGNSERMDSNLPKPYIKLGNTTILERTIKAFLGHPQIDGVKVVIRREHHHLYRKATENLTLIPCVIGGNDRQESVLRGLEAIAHHHPENVLIHDIARPFVSESLISNVIDELKNHKAVIPTLALTDTIKQTNNRMVVRTIDRSQTVRVQTPQAFNYDTILEAHRNNIGKQLTDDSAICEKSGIDVFTINGDTENYKITYPKDIKRMEQLLSSHLETRVGIGYDVHRLASHDPDTLVSQQTIKLCGVRIPFDKYLVGHSDADVGLHAIVDAIIGALGKGDIGIHFPPSDMKWQGADSERFLLHAYQLLKNRGGELVNIDITIICEKPKISEYRAEMIEHIAQTLKIQSCRLNIKATTTEKLGFTGSGEGIAAQAVATVRVPA
ncbi:MAG: bifunctional 2-C-methyl-D-erythritol 4-phosphate cytidylyltransferase/2-C-methyl-D-erythritol 2,4-cyclodiphosphate synthase [Rickettsiales bacterium]